MSPCGSSAWRRASPSAATGKARALDPGGSAFSSVLTREQIDALPDDPDEMEAVLKAMSPPGSVIRVDGFTGGRLPPKSQIRSIRLPRMDMFAAQNHGGMMGIMHIDIMTMPGMGPLRGSGDFNFLDESLNARNAFTPEKADEQLRQYGFSLSGTIRPNRTSFSINGGGGYQYTSPNLLAVLPDGTTVTDTLQQPRDSFNISARVDQGISKDHAVRLSVDVDTSKTRNLGIGGFNLFSRAYTGETTNVMVRMSENGPIGRRMFSETRLQLRSTDNQNQSSVEAPTIRVNDAFTGGGAQMRGGQEAFTFEFASDLDYVRGAHSWRTGALIEGGSFTSDDISNYLGTFTFASLADYNASRPATFSRRVGDPNLTYSTLQAAVYVQDDWRIARSLLVSAGVRYGVQGHVDDPWNLSPRATFAWSPLRNGSLTIRGSYGYFYEWIAGDLYKQTLLVDGVRQRDTNIVDPSYPIPGEVGVTPPTNRYLWSDDLVLPTAHRMNAGVERTLTKNSRLNVTYSAGWGRDLLRGQNLNYPVNGVRPNPELANDVTLAADASSTAQSVGVMFSLVRMDWKRTFFNAELHVGHQRDQHQRRLRDSREPRQAGRGMGARPRRHPAPRGRVLQHAARAEHDDGPQRARLERHAVQRHDRPRRQRRRRVQRSAAGHHAQLRARGGAGRPRRAAVLCVGIRQAAPGGRPRGHDRDDQHRRRRRPRARLRRRRRGQALSPRGVHLGPEPAEPRQLHGLQLRDDVTLLRPGRGRGPAPQAPGRRPLRLLTVHLHPLVSGMERVAAQTGVESSGRTPCMITSTTSAAV